MFQLTEFDRQLLTMAEMQQAKVKFGAFVGMRYMVVPGFRAKFYVSRWRGMRTHYPELADEYVGDDVRWLSLRGGWELRKIYNRLSVSAVAVKESSSDSEAALTRMSGREYSAIRTQKFRDAAMKVNSSLYGSPDSAETAAASAERCLWSNEP